MGGIRPTIRNGKPLIENVSPGATTRSPNSTLRTLSPITATRAAPSSSGCTRKRPRSMGMLRIWAYIGSTPITENVPPLNRLVVRAWFCNSATMCRTRKHSFWTSRRSS